MAGEPGVAVGEPGLGLGRSCAGRGWALPGAVLRRASQPPAPTGCWLPSVYASTARPGLQGKGKPAVKPSEYI